MNMKMLMQQAQQMQKKMKKQEEEFGNQEFDFSEQGIELKITGNLEIRGISIDADLCDADSKEMLEDMLMIAINNSMAKVQAAKDELMSANMPGGMGGGFPF